MPDEYEKPHDYIPVRDADFDDWFLRLKNYVVEKTSGDAPAWTHIPPTEVAALSAHYESWHAAHMAAVGPHAKPQTDAKKAERTSSEAFVRPFVNQYLRFKPVTNSDRDEMGIHNPDTHPSPRPQPDTPPDWSVRNDGLLRVRYDIRPAGAERPYIPQGFNGAVVRFTLADEPVTDLSQLTRSELLNKGISYMQFGQEADGKYLSASLEWETRSNKHSPPSAIQSIKVR
ncbi:MAG: hypothetical protein MdMp014T_1040 [Treponematales bacterium]